MNRVCEHALTCPTDVDDPLGPDPFNSQTATPADAPCDNAINCAGVDDPISNYSSEFDDDAEFFQDLHLCVCSDEEYSITMRAPGFIGPFTWTIDGDTPPGLVFYENTPTEGDLTIAGAFNLYGSYHFSINVTDGWGNTFIKQAVFEVLEIVTLDLPAPVVGADYSFQMEARGGSGNYAWRIVAGYLPLGILLGTNGLIVGIPETDITVPVTIEVVDLACVFVLDDSFSPQPRISMVGRTSSTIATTYGFDEFVPSGTIPTPRYKQLDWSGTTSQIFTFTVPFKPALTQSGAIGLTYSGTSTINLNGGIGLLREVNGGTPCTSTPNTMPAGRCLSPSGVTFWHGEFGGVDSRDWRWSFMYQDWPPTAETPTTSTTDRQGEVFDAIVIARQVAIGNPQYNHNFTKVLSDEYTEAEALANAVLVDSDGLAAFNSPRTTGFVSTYTTCEYDLVCVNLQLNTPYIVTVDLISSNGTIVSRTYNFTTGTAESDRTNTITDTVPTPVSGAFTLLSNPQIDFA